MAEEDDGGDGGISDHPLVQLYSLAKEFSEIAEEARTALPDAVTSLADAVTEVRATCEALTSNNKAARAAVTAGGAGAGTGAGAGAGAGAGDAAKNEDDAAADAGESTAAGDSKALVVASKDDAADDGDSDLPADVMQVVSDAQEDMMTAIQNLRKYEQAQAARPRWTRAVPPLRGMLEQYGTAAAIFVAASDHMYEVLFTIAFLFLGAALLLPKQLRALAAAWSYKDELTVFVNMDQDLQKRCRQLKGFLRLKDEARKARRYDVSKSVLDKGARKFWCTQFGAEHHEVATGRLIETLLFESKAAASYTDADRTVVYGMLRKVLDGNQDGSVSPGELHNFLAYFGPLPDCVRRTVDSLVEFRSEDSSRTVPWFVFTELDRSTVDLTFPREPVGTFAVRVSSIPGRFAMSVVKKPGSVTHYTIKNDGEAGYRFEGQKRHFPNLQALVKSYPAVFKRAYVDRTQRIVINVGGVRHETRMATFMKYPNSRLGRRFAKGMGLADGDKELFFDRDPGAFGVVLNYCRTGKLLVPMSVNEEAVTAEFAYFGIPMQSLHIRRSSALHALGRMMSNHSISEDDEGDGASAVVPAEKRQTSARLATVVSAATVVAAQTQHMALDAAARSASAAPGNGRAATGWARRSGGAVASPRNETPPVSVESRAESDGQRGSSAQVVAAAGRNAEAGGTN